MEPTSAKFDQMKVLKYWKGQKPPDLNILKSTNGKFTDAYFPPNKNSLLSLDQQGNFIDPEEGPQNAQEIETDLEWKRASEIQKQWEVFLDQIEFDDVNQGSIGNCYFLSAISALTEFPYIVYEKFRTPKFNPYCYYEIILHIDGEWQIVFVDDYFPFFRGTKQFAFAKPNGNELWAILLEKAWAKVNGGYSNTIGGIVSEPLCALTGFPTEYLYHEEEKAYELYKKILVNDCAGNILAAGSQQKAAIESYGLVPGHAYTLIAAKEKPDDDDLQLIKLRNPWGYKEWKGEWSDGSSNWTPALKKYFGVENKDDGTFWINLQDYIKYFSSTYICHLMYGASIKSFNLDYEKYFKYPIVFNLQVLQDAKVSLSVLFRNWRFNRNIKNPIRPFSMVVCRYDNNRNILSLQGRWSACENLDYVEDLQKGNYAVWLYCSYEAVQVDLPFKYTFTIASISPFQVKFLGMDRDFNLIQKLVMDNFKRNSAQVINSSRDYYLGNDRSLSAAGLNTVLMFNKSNKSLEIQLTATKLYNVQLLPPYKGMKSIEVKIPPNQSAVILGSRLGPSYVDFSFTTSLCLRPTSGKVPDVAKCEQFLALNFEQWDETTNSLLSSSYKFITADYAKKIPSFNEEQAAIQIGKSLIQSVQVSNQSLPPSITKESLMKEHRDIMTLILQLEDINKHVKVKWDKIKLDDGVYIGEVNQDSSLFHGRGAFIFTEGKEQYLGYWTNGFMDIRGAITAGNGDLLYEGGFLHGQREGFGTLFFPEVKESYQGDFHEDMMHGIGIYYFENGNTWEGSFVENMKNGIGLMIYSNKDAELVEFENDNMVQRLTLEEEETQTISKQLKDIFKVRATPRKSKSGMELIKTVIARDLQQILSQIVECKKDVSSIQVKEIDFIVEDSPSVVASNEYLAQIQKMREINLFMVEQLLDLHSLADTDVVHYLPLSEGYFMGELLNGEKHGRGALWNGHYYYIGYFLNGIPGGLIRQFDANKVLLYEGTLNSSYLYEGKGILYFDNGDVYDGDFVDNYMSGIGTYTWVNGTVFVGKFDMNMFEGDGKIYYENGTTEVVIYEKNQRVMSYGAKSENEISFQRKLQFDSFRTDYPEMFGKLMKLPPVREDSLLNWKMISYDNGSFYLGQIDDSGALHGRGGLYYPGNYFCYHIGFYMNSLREGKGFLYDEKWNLIFEGMFEKNERKGHGRLYTSEGVYDGQWDKDKQNGLGVFTWSNNSRWEGSFKDNSFHGMGVFIPSEMTYTEEIVYHDGNIIRQEKRKECTDYIKSKNTKSLISKLKREYPYHMGKLLELSPSLDDAVLEWGEKDFREGHYIGQLNYHGKKQGRGVMISGKTKKFTIGYWQNDLREGFGMKFYDLDKLRYIGNFHMGRPLGKGTYFYLNNEKLEGCFDEIGAGEGSYSWADGRQWNGTFLHWTLHGTGVMKDTNGNSTVQSYQYSKPV